MYLVSIFTIRSLITYMILIYICICIQKHITYEFCITMVKAYYHISPESKYRVQSGKKIMSSSPIYFFKRYFLLSSWCLWANILQCIVDTFFCVQTWEHSNTYVYPWYLRNRGKLSNKRCTSWWLVFFDECICLTSSSSAHTMP